MCRTHTDRKTDAWAFLKNTQSIFLILFNQSSSLLVSDVSFTTSYPRDGSGPFPANLLDVPVCEEVETRAST